MRQTDRVSRVLQVADELRENLGQQYVGTEHILMALLKCGPTSSIAGQVLLKHKLTFRKVCKEVSKILVTKMPQTNATTGDYAPY